jgi:predicted permease
MQGILTVAFPIFALIGIGWLAGRRGMLGPNGTGVLNAFVTWFALPAMLFAALARVDFGTIVNLPFIAVYGGSMAITFAVGMVAARMMSRAGPAHMSVHGMSAAFGNVGYMGIPLCITAFGSQGVLPATMAVCIGGAGMMTLAIVIIEFERHRGAGRLATLGRVVRAVARSPILQAVALGMLAGGLHVAVPGPLMRFLDLLAASAGPCALFAIGHFISEQGLPAARGEILAATAGKVLLQPLAAWGLLALFPGLPPLWAKSALLLAALPGASNCFVLAKEYDTFVDGASASILLSTVASVATVSALVVVLGLG